MKSVDVKARSILCIFSVTTVDAATREERRAVFSPSGIGALTASLEDEDEFAESLPLASLWELPGPALLSVMMAEERKVRLFNIASKKSIIS